MAAAQKKLYKETMDALLLTLGSKEVSADISHHVLGEAVVFPNADAFADAAIAAGTADVDVVHRTLAFGLPEADPTINMETFNDSIGKGLPDLMALKVQRALKKAGGMNAKTVEVSKFAPQIRDMHKTVNEPKFMKEIFKAFRGKPAAPAAGGTKTPPARSDSTTSSTSPTKKTFGSKKTEEPASPEAGAGAGGEAVVTAGAKKTFGKKKPAETTAAEEGGGGGKTPTKEDSAVVAPTAAEGEAVVTAGAKKTFGKKRSETPNTPTPSSTGENTPSASTTTGVTSSGGATSSPTTEGETVVAAATKKTFGSKRTTTPDVNETQPAATATTEAKPPTATQAASAAAGGGGGDGEGEAVVTATKKTFGKKRTPTSSETETGNAINNNSQQQQQTASVPLGASLQHPASSSSSSSTNYSSISGASPNTMSPTPVTVSERSATGAVIVPRCPECALRLLVAKQDACCQTDWGARFVNSHEASSEGRVSYMLRNDINNAVEDASRKANELLEMKRQFVEARMKNIADQEASILRSLPYADAQRLAQEQHHHYSPSKAMSNNSSSALLMMSSMPSSMNDPLRSARAAMNSNPALLPDDDDAYARLREGANSRLRELALEEAEIKHQLSRMEQGREHELATAARGRQMLLSGDYSPSKSQPGSVVPNNASAWSASSSPSRKNHVRRW